MSLSGVNGAVMKSVLLVLSALVITACGGGGTGDTADASTDTDVDSDSDADTDADADADTDADSDTDSDTGEVTFEWVSIPSGTFSMGLDGSGWDDEMPAHEVIVDAFEILKSEVTVAQYRACFDEGVCTEPMQDSYVPPSAYDLESYHTWDQPGSTNLPVNAVNWFQSLQFCEWLGGTLPSEAQWEYVARNLGQQVEFPWGNDDGSCEQAIMSDGHDSCDSDSLWPVCSRPLGNTDQDVCDMIGSVHEWVEDCYHQDYTGAPEDGISWVSECFIDGMVVTRGGGFTNGPISRYSRTYGRRNIGEMTWSADVGFRCVR